jgi:hypothetical protein
MDQSSATKLVLGDLEKKKKLVLGSRSVNIIGCLPMHLQNFNLLNAFSLSSEPCLSEGSQYANRVAF